MAQTTTQIAREAPFLEDYRRRLVDGAFTLADKPISQFQRGIAGFAPTEAAAFSEAARQMGIDPTTGQRTGVASFEPFIQQAQATMGLGIPSLQQAQAQYDPATCQEDPQQSLEPAASPSRAQVLHKLAQRWAKTGRAAGLVAI